MTQSTLLSVSPISVSSGQRTLGMICALMTVMVWSGYFLSLRAGALSPLGTLELSLIRFSLPALLLSPLFFRSIQAYRQVHPLYLAGIVLGSGWGFFYLSLMAMKASSVLVGSTLIPGAAPAFVTLVAVAVFRQPLPMTRHLGLLLILLGVVGFIGSAIWPFQARQLTGIGLLLCAAFIWALFTLSVRQSELAPLQVAALVVVPNGVAVAGWALFRLSEIDFTGVSLTMIGTQVIVQGILVGIFSGLFYSTAIRRLGAEPTSAIGSATPVVASVLAWLLLGEGVSWVPALALICTATGVLVASRAK
ncbi:DMT family transporter [Reinekea blandensis]|uniref:Permease of the drug/metabolite transporter (DMT) superfamily protein n=1 Tax=Reinekea blandensis MED297 TaxID=314283 RepID=A4BKI0_9GAMM|nr:DMT family transporter [Reinekea blandensis]EAR07379.1 Permease of the drug/metabolite transporter (DMT) superfamily protein [Reinekea sp. MED297] [Reinekea blandensis MED297]